MLRRRSNWLRFGSVCLFVAVTTLALWQAEASLACNLGAIDLAHGLVNHSVDYLINAQQRYAALAQTGGRACPSAWRHQAEVAEALGQYELALGLYESALANAPGDILALFRLSALFAKQSDVDQAIAILDQRVPSTAFWAMSWQACRQHDFVRADAYRRVALRLPQQIVLDHLNTGTCYWSVFGMAQAIQLYRASLLVLPNSAELHEQLAVALAVKSPRTQSDVEEAIAHLRVALSLEPIPRGYLYLVSLLEESGQPAEAAKMREKALDYLNRAIADQPSNAWLFYYRGLIRGQPWLVPDLERSVAIDATQADFWLHLARAYALDSCNEAAQHAYREVVRLLPNAQLTETDRRCLNQGKAP